MGCHDRPVLTQTSAGRLPQVTHSLPAQRVAAVGTSTGGESGPQRAVREAEEQFRDLLSTHIAEMRRRGVCEEVLGPFERELLRLGPSVVTG